MPQLWKRWTFRDEDSTHSDVSAYGYGFYLTFASRNGGSYTGANAFGATAQVEVSHDSGIGLIVSPGTKSFVDDLMASTRSVPMAPAEARQAVANAHVVIRGTLRAYEPGKVVMCGTEYETATLDDPYDVDRKICVLSVEFTDIRVLATNGDVLATWDQSTPAR